MLQKDNMTFQTVKKMFFDIVSEQFDCCQIDKSGAITDALISYVSECEPVSKITPELFKVILSEITIDEQGRVAVRFVNDVVIKAKERNEEDEQQDDSHD